MPLYLKTFFLSIILLPLFLSDAQENSGERQGKQPTPEEILRFVRHSYTQYNQEFTARLSKGMRRIPFILSMNPGYIDFRFSDPPQTIRLVTKGGNFTLYETVGGETSRVLAGQYGEPVRDTTITYEDLAMRFLYWPDAKILGHEKIKTRPAVKLELTNPDRRGPYGVVHVWIDKVTGGLLKMEGYDRGGELIKQFDVTSGKRVGDVWIADMIRVRSIDPDKELFKKETTWLEIEEVRD